jgi:hypothetical protein
MKSQVILFSCWRPAAYVSIPLLQIKCMDLVRDLVAGKSAGRGKAVKHRHSIYSPMDRLPWNAIHIDPTSGILRILTASSAATITPGMLFGCSVTLLSAATAIPSETFTPTISVTLATYRPETEDSAAFPEPQVR